MAHLLSLDDGGKTARLAEGFVQPHRNPFVRLDRIQVAQRFQFVGFPIEDAHAGAPGAQPLKRRGMKLERGIARPILAQLREFIGAQRPAKAGAPSPVRRGIAAPRSEEHTSELQSLMRISYAVFCLKKKNITS